MHCFLRTLICLVVSAQIAQAAMPPPSQKSPPSTFESIQQHSKPGPTGLPKPPPAPSSTVPPSPLTLAPTTVFVEPGIAALQGSEWVGSEHLFNLPNTLGIVVDIYKANGMTLPMTDDALREKIAEVFKKGRISERKPLVSDKTPLPFFQMMLIFQPIDKGYVVYYSGRLFEDAGMKRVQLPNDISWQVITWEKQEMRIFPADQLQTQVDEAVLGIANAFVERFNSYPQQAAK